MLRIRLSRGVAVRALKHGVVRRIGVAGGANAVCAAMIRREPGVVESCAEPIRGDPGGVAGGARRRKAGSHMIRIACPAVIGFVAGVAIGRRPRKHTSDMATAARHVHVRTLKGKWGVVMIENGAQPIRSGPGGVAQRAILRIIQGDVIGHAREGPGVDVILGVATVASGRQGPCVIVRVACCASDGGVGTLKRKRSGAVVEGCVQPVDRCVTQGAILGEIRSYVIRHAGDGRGAVVVRGVAAIARGGRAGIVVAGMTLRALQIGVPVGKREELIVIEICLVPPRRGVACGAGGSREAGLGVGRIIRGVVVRDVAGGAIG